MKEALVEEEKILVRRWSLGSAGSTGSVPGIRNSGSRKDTNVQIYGQINMNEELLALLKASPGNGPLQTTNGSRLIPRPDLNFRGPNSSICPSLCQVP